MPEVIICLQARSFGFYQIMSSGNELERPRYSIDKSLGGRGDSPRRTRKTRNTRNTGKKARKMTQSPKKFTQPSPEEMVEPGCFGFSLPNEEPSAEQRNIKRIKRSKRKQTNQMARDLVERGSPVSLPSEEPGVEQGNIKKRVKRSKRNQTNQTARARDQNGQKSINPDMNPDADQATFTRRRKSTMGRESLTASWSHMKARLIRRRLSLSRY